jgi:hypothetical protein
MSFQRPAARLPSIVVALGVIVTTAGFPLSARGTAASVRADSVPTAIRLPDGVVATPVLEGVLWQGFLLELVALEIPMTVEHFLAQLARLVPERTLLSVSQGIVVAQWEIDRVSISIHVAHAPENRATGVLTAMRVRPTGESRVTEQSRCGDPVVRHIAGRNLTHALFDLTDPGDAMIDRGDATTPGLNGISDRPTFGAPFAAPAPDRQSVARIRGFVLNTGVDELVARLLHALPREGWTTMNLQASSRPVRSASIETVCGHRRLRLQIAHLDGRTMAIAFETD